MIPIVNNQHALQHQSMNDVLMIAYKVKNPLPDAKAQRCRFDLFVRLRPGIPSPFRDQQRTWCYRGDKFTDIEFKMLRNLLNHVKNKIHLYDRVELYDNARGFCPERTVIKIVDDVVIDNLLPRYAMMLVTYALPDFLKP